MTGATHAVVGLAALVAWTRLGGSAPAPHEVLVTVFGALLPDIDGDGVIVRPGSILRFVLPYRARIVIDELTTAVGKLANVLTGHRGFFHWPILPASALGYATIAGLPWLWWCSFGYASHLVADLMTKGGIPCYAPLSFRRRSVAPIRTGSVGEGFLAAGLLSFVVTAGFGLLPLDTRNGVVTMCDTLFSWVSSNPTQ